jgi:hypothetical protein
VPLTFHLAGINDQNFLMRDDETGTYWQQISGVAISGPLKGRHLDPVYSDELAFKTWKAEEPRGTVLRDVPVFVSEYASKDWDAEMKKEPTVLSYAEPGLAPRDLMLGVHAFGASRAFPYDVVLKQKLIQDHVGSEPVMLVTAEDGHSVRVFRRRLERAGRTPEFYRVAAQKAQGPAAPLLMDDVTGSEWNFQGCAISGTAMGTCLERIEAIKDYWFDWRHYNPGTTVYGRTDRRSAND